MKKGEKERGNYRRKASKRRGKEKEEGEEGEMRKGEKCREGKTCKCQWLHVLWIKALHPHLLRLFSLSFDPRSLAFLSLVFEVGFKLSFM